MHTMAGTNSFLTGVKNHSTIGKLCMVHEIYLVLMKSGLFEENHHF